jgi:hypothetical protein
VTSWVHLRPCRVHDEAQCDCEPVMHIDVWRLTDDAGRVLGSVQRFYDDAPYYGTWAGGRTGAMGDLIRCQARVELGDRS